jgi:aspartyl-tRNA(Asn)/glutamyl-tRNA(Gln) amidotransferase subunit B
LIKLSCNYLITDLQGLLKGGSVADDKFLITPEHFAEFVDLIHQGQISSKIAKMVLQEMFDKGSDPSDVIEKQGLTQISDEGELGKIIDEVIKANLKVVEDYQAGKATSLQFLVGQVMQKTKGKANPPAVQKLLKEMLTKRK